MKYFIKIFSALIICLLVVVFVCDIIVTRNACGRIFDDMDAMPHRNVGLLLGTSPYWGKHYRNYYFENRIHAAADLYNANKLDTIIVSGGNYVAQGGYDEPRAMRDSLMARGVPSDKIIMDYDGTRTLNSIAKVREAYTTDTITIISQRYHNERALYQADRLGVNAIAYSAVTPQKLTKLIKNRGREYLARVKLFIDIAIHTKPSYTGQN